MLCAKTPMKVVNRNVWTIHCDESAIVLASSWRDAGNGRIGMNKFFIGVLAVALGAASAAAQSLDDLNIQIHGYATQGFLYTTNNNILTTNSSNGSPAWTEAVMNVTAQPDPKLRVGLQTRYFMLGNYGNEITLDWAMADYKFNDKFGVRFGKVKSPTGLWNELQDIDPSYIWSLLPQGVYPIGNRNSLLSHYGGVVYGTYNLGQKLGKLDLRAFGGERVMGSGDGFVLTQKEAGMIMPNGINGATYGGSLRWRTPLNGLMVGASDDTQLAMIDPLTFTIASGPIAGTYTGTQRISPFSQLAYFGKYEKGKVMIAGEYTRLPVHLTMTYPLPVGLIPIKNDQHTWYGMASYKVTGKLTTGVYGSQLVIHSAPLGPARYSKDWAISGRYDFSQFLYAKAEQHFIDGTAASYDTDMNPKTASLPTGLQPNTKLTILKIGVSF
jgi:hypothetical protein